MTNEKKKAIRNFGLLVGFILCAYFGFRLTYRFGGLGSKTGLGIGLVLIVFGLIAPSLLAPAHALWMKLAACLGWFNTRLILGLVFFLMVVPFGMVARLLGKDLIDARIDGDEKESYWLNRPESPFDGNKQERMF